MPITQDTANHQFTDGHGAVLDYQQPSAGVIDYTHTFVPENERNQGVGESLAKTALDYARQHQLRVIPTCPFVASYIKQHDEYTDLLAQ